MGTQATCCKSSTHSSQSTEINLDRIQQKKKKLNDSSSDDVQIQISSSSKKQESSSGVKSILKGSANSNENSAVKKQKKKVKARIQQDGDEDNDIPSQKNIQVDNNKQSITQQKNDQIKEITKNDDSIKVQTRGILNIIYGTTSGNSARLSADLFAEAKQQQYQPKLIHLGDFDPVQFINMQRTVFILSTYGTGGPTADAKPFFDWISKQNDSQLLSHQQYVIFALGNSTFENFTGFGVKINAKLQELGSKSLYPIGRGDAAENTTDQDFQKWKENLWNTLNEKFNLYETTLKELRQAEAGFELMINEGEQELDFDNYIFEENKIDSRLKEYFAATNAPIKEITELRQKPEDSSCLHVDYEIGSTSMAYDTAGNLAVYPENDPESVKKFAQMNGYNLDDVFIIQTQSETEKVPLPTPMKIKTFLTKFCDIYGPVNKSILQSLADLSSNHELQQKCDEWIKDNNLYEENIKLKNHSIYTLCKQFNIRIPLANLIKISNRIFPRFYTISSSNKAYPKNIHMCISISKIKDPDGYRSGIASQFFTSLKSNYSNKKVRISHIESTFKLPQDKNVPIIMVGPGAGLAPFRAFLQEKQYLEEKSQNDSFGECSLYFGCRGKQVDYIYQNDLEQFQQKNICNHLRLAFSRDGPNKVYVQDLLQQDLDQIAEFFLNKNAIIYVCGSKAVGEAVKEFLSNLYTQKENLVPYLADMKISDLESDKRLIMEVWG